MRGGNLTFASRKGYKTKFNQLLPTFKTSAAKINIVLTDGENITRKGILSLKHLVAQPCFRKKGAEAYLLRKATPRKEVRGLFGKHSAMQYEN